MSTVLSETNPALVGKFAAGKFVAELSGIQFALTWNNPTAFQSAYAHVFVLIKLGPADYDIAGEFSVPLSYGSSKWSGSYTFSFPEYPDCTAAYQVEFTGKPASGNSVTVRDTPDPPPEFSIVGYFSPSFNILNHFRVYRCNASGVRDQTGSCALYSLGASIWPVENVNTKAFRLKYRAKGTTTWTTLALPSDAYSLEQTNVLIQSGGAPVTFLPTVAYEFMAEVQDLGHTITASGEIGVATALLHLNANGNGLAIGEYAEAENLMDVSLPARFRKSVSFDSDASVRAALGVQKVTSGDRTVPLAANTITTLDVTFLEGLFDNTPAVTATPYYAMPYSASNYIIVAVDRVDKTGFQLRFLRVGGAITIHCCWIAAGT